MIYNVFTDYLNRIEYIDEIIYDLEIISILIYTVYDDKYLKNDVYLNISTVISGIMNIITDMKKNNLVIWNDDNEAFPEQNILYFTIGYYDNYKTNKEFLEKKIDLNIFHEIETFKIDIMYKNIKNLIYQFVEYRDICLRYLLYDKNKDHNTPYL
jgi:hypothetical protein